MEQYEATLIGAFVGAIGAILTGVAVHILNRLHQNKIQRNQLAVQMAIEEMKRLHDLKRAEYITNLEKGTMAIYNAPQLQSIYYDMLAFTKAMERHERKQFWERARKWVGAAWSAVIC